MGNRRERTRVEALFPSFRAVVEPGTGLPTLPCDTRNAMLDCKNSGKSTIFAMNNPRQPGALKQDKHPRIEVYWTTVTYRTVAVYS
jgi:hypothetical protein